MQNTTIAVDLAKSVFEVAVSHAAGKVAERHRFTRKRLSRYLALAAPATVVMEACGSAHHWAREAEARGHRVRLLPAQDVARYVRGNKTDRSDAKGILEANRNEDICPVPVKSIEQQALLGLHRMRQTWVAGRTSRLNTLRGLLRELGVTIPTGARQVVPHVWSLVSEVESPVPESLRPVLAEAAREIGELERRIQEVETQLEALARESGIVRRYRTIPGVGLLTSTAIAASVGDLSRYPSGRHFSSSLGLTPREASSGSTRRLGRITKRGDPYLRTLLIHGARSVLHHAKRAEAPDRLRSWALDRERALGHNKAAVAVANKLARIVWAVSVREVDYEPRRNDPQN
jgi:transposase